jgi:hypothetical protein
MVGLQAPLQTRLRGTSEWLFVATLVQRGRFLRFVGPRRKGITLAQMLGRNGIGECAGLSIGIYALKAKGDESSMQSLGGGAGRVFAVCLETGQIGKI